MAFQAPYRLTKPPNGSAAAVSSALVTNTRSVNRNVDALRLNPQRLAFALDIGGDALWSFDVPNNHLAVVGRWCSILGYDQHDIEPSLQAWHSLTHPEDRLRMMRVVAGHLRGRTQFIEIEFRIQTKAGGYIWAQARGKIAASSLDGGATLLIGTMIDINRLKERELAAVYTARHDLLTGLPTRAAFYERLSREIGLGGKFALLACDLDGFKKVNDRLGHAAGDELLRIVAQRLMNSVRCNDLVARIGGDEFMVILGRVENFEDAQMAKIRVVEAIAQPLCIEKQLVEVGVSVGIALGPKNGANIDDLCSFADAALYAAKRIGVSHTGTPPTSHSDRR